MLLVLKYSFIVCVFVQERGEGLEYGNEKKKMVPGVSAFFPAMLFVALFDFLLPSFWLYEKSKQSGSRVRRASCRQDMQVADTFWWPETFESCIHSHTHLDRDRDNNRDRDRGSGSGRGRVRGRERGRERAGERGAERKSDRNYAAIKGGEDS